MKYFRNDATGEIYAFGADGSEDAFIPSGLALMSDAEVAAYIESIMELLPTAAVTERAWRDGQLDGLVWLRDRHRDQLEIGVTTTLMPEQFAELLVFMQALRDWPQSEAFPDTSARPVAPVFLEQVRVEQ